MQSAYIVTGTLTDDHTVALDEPLPVSFVKVRLMIEPIQEQPKKKSCMQAIETIYQRQRDRGHIPPTREEVDRYIQEERASWSDES